MATRLFLFPRSVYTKNKKQKRKTISHQGDLFSKIYKMKELKTFEDLSELFDYLESKYDLIYSSTSTDDLDWYTWTGILSTKGGKRVLVVDYDGTHAATDFAGCDIDADFFGEDIAEEIRCLLFELR